MRAFWPEEMVAAGSLRKGSVMYRLLTWAERRCLFNAGAVVSLTDAAVDYMRAQLGARSQRIRFAVAPTCVDLERFTPVAHASPVAGDLTIGSVGTVISGWFRFPWLAAFFAAVARRDGAARFEVVSRDDAATIRRGLDAAGIAAARVEISSARPADVPAAMARFDAVAMFFETGVAKLGSCPTRMGEVLACGLPVVANPGVGDVGEIIRRYRVGVLVDDAGEAAMDRAAAELAALMQDSELAARCRHAAEDRFSLQKGAETYDRLYRELAPNAV
jgi:glycosyltransferase involved in cell wall biosynthesis